MIATLCWKEYREQRGIWLAIVVLGLLLIVGVGSAAKNGLWHLHQDEEIRSALSFIMFALVAGHGVVCGAQLLAGEKEAGTQAFLDILSAVRVPLWKTKLGMGCLLTFTQSQVLAGLGATFHITAWPVPLLFPAYAFLSIYGLLWGMVGGAVCRFMVPAVLVGAMLMVFGLMLAVPLPPFLWPVPFLGLGTVAAVVSWKAFCRADEKKIGLPRTKPRRKGLSMPRLIYLSTGKLRRWYAKKQGFGCIACWWLAWRQGRWIIAAGVAGCLFAGLIFVPYIGSAAPFVLLTIGLVCGLAAFAPEQIGEQERFLGAQRFSPGWMWLSKSIFWFAAGLLMFGAGLLTVLIQGDPTRHGGYYRQVDEPSGLMLHTLHNYPFLFTVLWPMYGFCFGQFFALLSRRIIVATVVAAFACLVVLTAWLPSLLMGGLSGWEIMTIPLVLLVVCRLSMWTWLCGRLYTRRHLALLCGCGLFAVLWLAGNLWYRSVEIPDVGEPFDVAAYEAELDQAAKNGAGNLIRQAAADMDLLRKQLAPRFAPPPNPAPPPPGPGAPGAPASKEDKTATPNLLGRCERIIAEGWTAADPETSSWLDAMFAGAWPGKLREGVNRPLGMIVDPRIFSTERLKIVGDCQVCNTLFCARALQLQARGDADAGLEHLAVALALSRQLRHHALSDPFILAGRMDRETTLLAYDQWLAEVGPDAKRIRAALKLLRLHETDSPGAVDSFKACYISMLRNLSDYECIWHQHHTSSSAMEQRIFRLATEAPWEQERAIRRLNVEAGSQMGKYIRPEWYQSYDFNFPRDRLESPAYLERFANLTQFWLHGRQLVTALALYDVDKGKPARSLSDLVPAYLPKIPVDTYLTQQPFLYRVAVSPEAAVWQGASITGLPAVPGGNGARLASSTAIVTRGEFIHGFFAGSSKEETRRLLPGQGVVYVEKYKQNQNQMQRVQPPPPQPPPPPGMPGQAPLPIPKNGGGPGGQMFGRGPNFEMERTYFIVPLWTTRPKSQ